MTGATNLTPSPTRFIGRAAERTALVAALERSRLVTLLGPPGMGKTRLARELGLGIRDHFPGGVWFCDAVAALSREDLLISIAHALGMRAPLVTSLADEVADVIRRRGVALLVLDNFEQLDDEAARLVGWMLERAPEVRVLVTSRELVRIAGEHRVELWGLGPAEAEELFEDRARAVRAEFEPFGEERAAIRAINERLDGNPLAIELAAARTGLATPRELEAILAERIDVLRTNERDVPARHASLRAAIESSLSQLTPWEREAITQCAVFRGSFGLADADAVLSLRTCADAPATLTVLESLRGRSLLAPGDRPTHVRLLVSVQELVARELSADTRRRHAIHQLALSERRATDVEGPARAEALASGERQFDDAIAAFRWAEQNDTELAARLALALDVVISLTGPFPTRSALLEGLVDRVEDPALAARLRLARAVARLDLGDYPGVVEDATALLAESAEPALRARARLQLGNASLFQGHWDAARERYEAALAEARSDPLTLAKIRNNLALIASGRGEVDEAREHYEEALREGRRVSEHYGASVLPNLAQLHHQAGDLARARATFEEAERQTGAARDRFYGCFALLGRAWLELDEGDLRAAEACIERARALLDEIDDARLEGLIAATRGALEASRDRIEEAVRALGSSHEVLVAVGDRGCLDAYDALEGFLDLARARAAGRPDVEALHVRAAEQRVARLRDRAARDVVLTETRIPLQLLERALEERVAPTAETRLEVGDGWFRLVGGGQVDLSRRRAVRRLFDGLVKARLEHPGRPVPLDAVLALGWPRERMDAVSGSRRVYVSIHTLRKIGLGRVLLTAEEGYLLDPDVPIVRVAEG